MPAKKRLVLGSRGSRLALVQANLVKKLLEEEYGDLEVSIRVIKTTGDRLSKGSLSTQGGKGLFLKEIEEQLLSKKVDVGVHSMKDVPVILPPGLVIPSVLQREDPRDVFLSKKFNSLLQLPKKARIGTSSMRRRAQLKNFRPDLEVVPLRGNIDTRLKKIGTGGVQAVVLAAAGLVRLGLSNRITEYLHPSIMLPAVGQGTIALEIREADDRVRRLVDSLNHIETMLCVQAERAFLRGLEGDCQAPIAAYARIDGQNMDLTGMVASVDGRELLRDRVEGNIRDAVTLGETLANTLRSHGAREILRSSRGK